MVNYPLTFNLMLPFTDTIVPKFVDPYPLLYPPAADESLEDALIADILIRPQVVADRAATMYYLIAPVNGNKPDGQNTVDPLLKEVQKDITIKPGDANNPPVVIKGYTFEQGNLDDCLGFAMLSGDKVPSGGIYGTWDIKNPYCPLGTQVSPWASAMALNLPLWYLPPRETSLMPFSRQ